MTTSAAARFAQQLLDPGSWSGWDTPPRGNPTTGPYADALARARERSGGADESVRTGEGRVDGHRIALIVGEFDFLAGSIGVAACDRLLRAVRRATAERLPLLACPATGGTRMQEGTPAFVGMAPIVAALAAHKAAGLPYLVHLRHPVTGGVLASWGSVGQLTTAEPGALIGFLGPRVYESLYGHAFPKGVQQAENLARLGVVDAVLDTDALRAWVSDVLRVLAPTTAASRGGTAGAPLTAFPQTEPVGPAQPDDPPAGERAEQDRPGAATPHGETVGANPAASAEGTLVGPAGAAAAAAASRGGTAGASSAASAEGALGAAAQADNSAASEQAERDRPGAGAASRGGTPGGAATSSPSGGVWRSVTITRSPGRPGLRELLGTADAVVGLSGTQAGERDEGMGVVLARFGGRPCVVVGHDRAGAVAQGQEVGPGGLRAARRGMGLAAELGLPLVTVIDTAGALLSQEAEEGALAGEIARCLQELMTLPVPTLSLLLGQGTGGAALALLPADRVLAAAHTWLAPLPPEGASEILYRTTERAAELAVAQRIGAAELLHDGTVDRIIPEPDDADDATALIRTVSDTLTSELAALSALFGRDPAERAQQRGRRGAPFVRLDDEV